MPRIKRVTKSGDVLEQEVFNVAAHTKNLRRIEPKQDEPMTAEEKEEHNRRQSLKRFIRLCNANFGPQSLYVTLTFDNEHLPPDWTGARHARDNYIRRLRYKYPELAAVAVMGRGKRTGRMHIHCILSGAEETEVKSKWAQGTVVRVEALRAHNYYDGIDHGCDYTGLAAYLFNHWTKEQGGKRWKPTRNMHKPDRKEPTFPKRQYSVDKPPPTPKGYQLVEKRQGSHSAAHYLYFKYVKIPPPDMRRPIKRRE